MIRLTLITCFISSVCYCQTNDLYHLAFNKRDNFQIITEFRGKIPKKFLIIDTTNTWNPETFFMKDLDLGNPRVIDSIKREEHHPYINLYLFSNPKLDSLISNGEKEKLSHLASQIKSVKVDIKGNKYQTVEEFKKPLGFYFLVTTPLYSADKRYAFLTVYIKSKSVFLGEKLDEYYGILTLMFENDNEMKWKQIGIKELLIL